MGLAGPDDHRPSAALGWGAAAGGGRPRAGGGPAGASWPTSPRGNLDNANSERLHGLFARLAREFETALIVVTHNRALAGRADRVLSLEGGRLIPLSGVESMP